MHGQEMTTCPQENQAMHGSSSIVTCVSNILNHLSNYSYQMMHTSIMYAFVYHVVNHMYFLSYGLIAHYWNLDNNVKLT